MRRTLPAAALTLAAVVGLATPAMAEDATTTPARAPRSIELTCHQVTVDDSKPAIHCAWDAVDGADAYRVVATARRGRKGGFVVRKTDQTEFTRKDVKPGTYNVVVQALEDGSHKAIARSNRERIVVERDGSAAS
jgi:hypothetical protein